MGRRLFTTLQITKLVVTMQTIALKVPTYNSLLCCPNECIRPALMNAPARGTLTDHIPRGFRLDLPARGHTFTSMSLADENNSQNVFRNPWQVYAIHSSG
jgi:hypothetical protein